MTFLEKILAVKRSEIRSLHRRGAARLERAARSASPVRPWVGALRRRGPVAVIAEIKRRSPSKGLIREDFRPSELARSYERGGAAALSVLTDTRFFGGSAAALRAARRSTSLPILRKDFILDPLQVVESRAIGADAILLIARILSAAELKALSQEAHRLGLGILYEVHSAGDLKKIAPLGPKVVGVNNRDLDTFRVSLGVTRRLAPRIGRGALVVSESGIETAADLRRLGRIGVRAVLVGESLMRRPDVETALKSLRGGLK